MRAGVCVVCAGAAGGWPGRELSDAFAGWKPNLRDAYLSESISRAERSTIARRLSQRLP